VQFVDGHLHEGKCDARRYGGHSGTCKGTEYDALANRAAGLGASLVLLFEDHAEDVERDFATHEHPALRKKSLKPSRPCSLCMATCM
jgi:hypothetical protein